MIHSTHDIKMSDTIEENQNFDFEAIRKALEEELAQITPRYSDRHNKKKLSKKTSLDSDKVSNKSKKSVIVHEIKEIPISNELEESDNIAYDEIKSLKSDRYDQEFESVEDLNASLTTLLKNNDDLPIILTI